LRARRSASPQCRHQPWLYRGPAQAGRPVRRRSADTLLAARCEWNGSL